MNSFPDTSFLCALYRRQENSEAAIQYFRDLAEPLPVSGLLYFEFRQGVRREVFRHAHDRTKGYALGEAMGMLVDFECDLARGVLQVTAFDWPALASIAERLSDRHTVARGHRAFDLLHVATALALGASGFLTFDANQRRLAETEGLRVPL